MNNSINSQEEKSKINLLFKIHEEGGFFFLSFSFESGFKRNNKSVLINFYGDSRTSEYYQLDFRYDFYDGGFKKTTYDSFEKFKSAVSKSLNKYKLN